MRMPGPPLSLVGDNASPSQLAWTPKSEKVGTKSQIRDQPAESHTIVVARTLRQMYHRIGTIAAQTDAGLTLLNQKMLDGVVANNAV